MTTNYDAAGLLRRSLSAALRFGVLAFVAMTPTMLALGCKHHDRAEGDGKGVAARADAGQAAGSDPLEVKQGGRPPKGPVNKPEPPLNVAARAGDADAVRELMAAGADVNAFGDDRKTALMAAAERGQGNVVGLLLDKGADANLRDAEGRTASQIAQEKGFTGLSQLLKQREVKPPPVDADPAAAPADPIKPADPATPPDSGKQPAQ
jgi:hypothetical protein